MKGNNISRKRKLFCYGPLWRKNVPECKEIPLRNKDYISSLDEIKSAVQHQSPVEIFEEIVTPQIDDCKLGCIKNNTKTPTVDELIVFFYFIVIRISTITVIEESLV